MRLKPNPFRGARVVASFFVLIGLAARPGFGDEPQSGGRFGRLFRFGGGSSSNDSPGSTSRSGDHPLARASESIRASGAPTTPSAGSPTAPVSTPESPSTGPGLRITAQPRVARPPTEADPIVTRISIGRSDNGGRFGMFLQVFADGIVMDGEGIHRVGGDVMKPLVESLRQAELYRLKGHCGSPSTDFIEQSHVVVYERAYGKLRANSFSYSGNQHGCDPSVRKLHTALDAIQTKLASPTNAVAGRMPEPAVESAPYPAARNPGKPVLGLTPERP